MRVGKYVIDCAHCDLPCDQEHVTFSRKSKGEDKVVVLNFCSNECMREHFWDVEIRSQIQTSIDKHVRGEFNWLHKQVCPSCRKRILTRLHSE